MAISYTQVQELLSAISLVVPDQLDCDGCFELMAEFAESERRGDQLSDALEAVVVHLKQCPCCAYEYEALLEAVRAANFED